MLRMQERQAHSYMTMDTASFRILSPKITLYSFGSTFAELKIARMVTGSVALSVEPKMRHSSKVNFRPSRPRKDHIYTRTLKISPSCGWSCGYSPDSNRRDEGAEEGERQNHPEISKEVLLCVSAAVDKAWTLANQLTCLSSYPELRMIGGSKRLKNKVCLNDWPSDSIYSTWLHDSQASLE